MEFHIKRNEGLQYFFTLIVFVAIILVPIVNNITFKETLFHGIDIGDLEQRYDLIIIIVIFIGIITTSTTNLIFYYPKYSVRRGYLTLSQSILDVTYFFIFTQMSSISVFIEGSGIVLNLEGFYILLIVAFLPFVFKNVFDVIDFNKNKEFYQRKLQAKAA